MRSLHRARADIISKFENEVRDEDHGHARNEKMVADLCTCGLGACDERRPVRTVTHAVGMRMQRTCTGTRRHARVGAHNASEKMEQTGRVHQVARAMEELLREELETLEMKNANVQKGYAGFIHENDKDEGTCQVQDEMGNSCTTMCWNCSAFGKGGIGMTTEAVGVDPELCVKARREEVEYIRRHWMYTRVHKETSL